MTEEADPAVSMGKRIAFWIILLFAAVSGLATLVWALDLFVGHSASTERSSRFFGIFGVQALFWGSVLFRHRGWRTA